MSPSGWEQKTTARFENSLTDAGLPLRLTSQCACTQAGNGVFDMGQFVDQHPGGASAITRNCGKQVFNWAATNGGHESFVYVPIVAGETLRRSN